MPNQYYLTFLLVNTLLSCHMSNVVAANIESSTGPRVEIKPSVPIVFFESQAPSSKVLTCKALGSYPGMFDKVRWTGPNRSDNWEELKKRHKIKETTRNGYSVELEFQRPTPDDSGIYYCHGTYQSSDSYNSSIEVKVFNPIKLENCPERQFVVENSLNQKITCRITGDTPSVVFFKDDVQIDNTNKRYKWDNEDGLEILGPAGKIDAGVYTIEVTTDLTGDRRLHHITVEVHSAPEIVPFNQPPNAIAEYSSIEGEQAELKCEVQGNPRPLVLWYGPTIQKRNLTHVGGYFVNQEKGTLLISKVNRVEDNGNFECFAYNNVGSAKRSVSMAVLQKPAIIAFENKTVDDRSDVVLECRSTGFPRPTISIRKHGLNQQPYRVGDGLVKDISETEEGGGAEIYVYRVKLQPNKSHFGVHYCNATNQAGSSERVGHLAVKYAPDLSQTPTTQYFKLGKNSTVTCHIKAFPIPTVSWFNEFNQQILNTPISFKTSPDEQTHIVTMMPPSNLQATTSRYRCKATNLKGENEVVITTTPTTRPGLVNAVTLDTAPTSAKVQLTVSNDGGDRVRSFRYTAIGQTLDSFRPYGNFPIDSQNDSYIDAIPTSSVYTFKNLLPYYRYRVLIRAVNEVDIGDASEFHIDTRKPTRPEPPQILKPTTTYQAQAGITSEYQNGYLLRWSPPETDNGDPIVKYIMRFFRVNPDSPDLPLDEAEERIFEQVNERPLHASIGPLDVNRHYRILLYARNNYGDSEAAKILIGTSSDRPTMPDFGPQALTWLTEPSTPLLIGLLTFVLFCLVLIDIMFCFCFQVGVGHTIRNCCCPDKANSVISDKTYT